LGVKEMTYKLLFIGSAIQPTDQRTGGPVSGLSAAELAGSGASASEVCAYVHFEYSKHLYTVHCTLYTVHCALYTANCTL
jgi:hypothetical protein